MKKVALELGGKNPNIVFADADFDTAVDYALTAVFLHSGQVCSAGARLLVEDELHDRFVDEVVRAGPRRSGSAARSTRTPETGPLISAAHRAKVEAYVAAGLAEGAVLRCGGTRPDDPALRGRLLLPADGAGRLRARHVRGTGRVVRPGAHRGAFRDEDEAVALANDTVYGLAGAVWTQDDGQGAAGRVPAADRHRMDQRLPPVRPAGRVGRLEAVRLRPRTGPRGARRVPGGQAHLAQHSTRARRVVRMSWSTPAETRDGTGARGHRQSPAPGRARPRPAARQESALRRRAIAQAKHDDDALAEFGYKPELKRTLGNFHTFAAGISYISILTGTFQLFYFGVATAAPPTGGPGRWSSSAS